MTTPKARMACNLCAAFAAGAVASAIVGSLLWDSDDPWQTKLVATACWVAAVATAAAYIVLVAACEGGGPR